MLSLQTVAEEHGSSPAAAGGGEGEEEGEGEGELTYRDCQCYNMYIYLWSAVVVPDACCHASAHQQRRMLLTVLGQDKLSITCTHILRSPHEEHLTPSTALPLLLPLLTHIHKHTHNIETLVVTLI